MIPCPSCGAENVEGTRFCVRCGSGLTPAPQPEQWRYSGDLGQTQTEQRQQSSGYQSGGYAPPSASSYPTYTPGQNMVYQQGGGTDWQAMGANKKLAAGLCGILLGGFGIHKFVLGYSTEGIIMLLITVLTCGFGAMVTGVIGLVEGIIYLTKSDEEFVRTYVQNKKGWF
jgi:TM2 domain-containing membrane protein YozV